MSMSNVTDIFYLALIGVVILFGVYTDYTHTVKINANASEVNWIKTVLNNTDTNLTQKIDSINIVPQSVVSSICKTNTITTLDGTYWYGSVGCTVSNFTGGTLSNANIYIADSNSFNSQSDTQESALYHEIGHVYNQYHGIQDTESNADKYAEEHMKV